MKRKLSLLPVVVFGLALLTTSASAQMPEIISYQGFDPANPNGTINLTVSLFDAATGGTSVWNENHLGVSTGTMGVFSILIGSTGTAAPLGSLNWNTPYFMEIAVNGTPMTPRTELAASPYAFEALEALSVADASIVPDDIDDNGTDPTDGQVLAYDAATQKFKWVAAGGGGGGNITEIVAGPGIVITNGTGAVTTVGIANQGITSGMIANGAVNTQHIAPGAVASAQIAANGVITQHIGPQQITLPKINSVGATAGQAIMFNGTQLIYGNPTPGGPAGGELSGFYPNPIIADNVIDGDNVIDESLTGDDILNESLTADDIATGAVTTDEILNETILAEDIATGAVTTDEILNETILAEDIATGAVTTDEILNETILSEDIQDGTILSDDIATGPANTALITTGPPVSGFPDAVWRQIYSEVIEDETIRSEDIATGAVTTSEILNETILSEDIMDGQVMTVDIADLAVTNQKLGPDAVTTDKILDGEVMNPDIATDAVDSRTIQNESIMTQDIQDGQVTNTDLADNSVTTQKIQDGQVMNADLATDAVDSRVIQNESITSADILDNSITSADIQNGTVQDEDMLPGPDNTMLATNGIGVVDWDKVRTQYIQPGGANTYLQTDGTGTTVFWGAPAAGSIPPSAITPGAAHSVLTTNAAGTTAEWDFIETANIFDNAITTPKIADAAVTPIKIQPSGTNDWVLKTVAGVVQWAPDDFSLPVNKTGATADATNGPWSMEIEKSGTSQGVFRGFVSNAANASPAIQGQTAGTGAGVSAIATSGPGVNATSTTGTGVVATGASGASFTATGGTGVTVNSTGGPGVSVTTAGNNNGVQVQVNGDGDAVNAQNNGGAGRAGFFRNTNAANANDVVKVETGGPLPAGVAGVHIDATNLNSGAGVRSDVDGAAGWAGVFNSATGTDGVRIESNSPTADAMALWIQQGGMKLTYRTGAGPNTIMNQDDIVVVIPDDGGAGTTNAVTLPAAGTNGQVIWVVNGDNDAAMATFAGTINGPIAGGIAVTISSNRALGFVWSATEGGWAPLSL